VGFFFFLFNFVSVKTAHSSPMALRALFQGREGLCLLLGDPRAARHIPRLQGEALATALTATCCTDVARGGKCELILPFHFIARGTRLERLFIEHGDHLDPEALKSYMDATRTPCVVSVREPRRFLAQFPNALAIVAYPERKIADTAQFADTARFAAEHERADEHARSQDFELAIIKPACVGELTVTSRVFAFALDGDGVEFEGEEQIRLCKDKRKDKKEKLYAHDHARVRERARDFYEVMTLQMRDCAAKPNTDDEARAQVLKDSHAACALTEAMGETGLTVKARKSLQKYVLGLFTTMPHLLPKFEREWRDAKKPVETLSDVLAFFQSFATHKPDNFLRGGVPLVCDLAIRGLKGPKKDYVWSFRGHTKAEELTHLVKTHSGFCPKLSLRLTDMVVVTHEHPPLHAGQVGTVVGFERTNGTPFPLVAFSDVEEHVRVDGLHLIVYCEKRVVAEITQIPLRLCARISCVNAEALRMRSHLAFRNLEVNPYWFEFEPTLQRTKLQDVDLLKLKRQEFANQAKPLATLKRLTDERAADF
jgi:hypothetical protein